MFALDLSTFWVFSSITGASIAGGFTQLLLNLTKEHWEIQMCSGRVTSLPQGQQQQLILDPQTEVGSYRNRKEETRQQIHESIGECRVV